MHAHDGRIDHLHLAVMGGDDGVHQPIPDTGLSPTIEAIVDRRGRPVGFGTIGPTAAALQHVNDAADNPAIILSLDTTHIGWQVRFDPPPEVDPGNRTKR